MRRSGGGPASDLWVCNFLIQVLKSTCLEHLLLVLLACPESSRE